MGLTQWFRHLVGDNPPAFPTAPGKGAAVPDPVPGLRHITRAQDWESLCEAIMQVLEPAQADELSAEVLLALTHPEIYMSHFADELEQRGIEDPREVTPWLALVDGLQRRELCVELDWKLGMNDLVWSLSRLRISEERHVDYDSLDASEISGFDALTEAAAYLRPQGLTLAVFDIDSDSYPLVLLPADQLAPIEELAREVGQKVSAF